MKSHLLLPAALAGIAFATAAFAAGNLTDKKGMTLYMFDNDKSGEPTCYEACAVNWPPYLAPKNAKAEKDWSLVKRSDGKMQWAYQGHPLYHFKADKKKGDANGDGLQGLWHVVAIM